MDVKLLSQIIKGLLSDSGRAVLPGFGCFCFEQMPASFSDRGFTINPPYRKVVFNVSDSKDDTSLAELYARANGVSVAVAGKVTDECIRELRNTLQMAKLAVLPDLGKLKMTRGGMVFFVPDEALSLSPVFDDLKPVSLKSFDPSPVVGSVTEPTSIIEPTAAEPEPEVMEPEVAELAPEATGPAAEPDSTEPATEPATEPVMEPEPVRRSLPWWAVILIVVVALAVVFFAGLYLCGRFAPGLVDPLLYTQEELEIIHTAL